MLIICKLNKYNMSANEIKIKETGIKKSGVLLIFFN